MPRSNYEYPGYESSGPEYWTKTTLLYGAVTIGALWTTLPLWWMVTTALSANPTASTVAFLPNNPTLDNFRYVFEALPIFRWFINTIIFAGAVTSFNLIFDSLAGYALAKIDFIGREKIFLTFIATMMVPGMVLLIPVYIILSSLGWVNTYQGLILPLAANPFGIFLLRQHFKDLPSALGDAARMDGCNELEVFYKIYLPLTKPALAALGLYTFVTTWNNFEWPLIVASTDSMYTLPVAIFSVQSQYFTQWGIVLAAATLLVLPLLVAFISAQNYFIRGMSLSGMKG